MHCHPEPVEGQSRQIIGRKYILFLCLLSLRQAQTDKKIDVKSGHVGSH